ncbi:MAG: hypothetical protein AABW50_04700 [Nanoarchaeota archaeon]|mgnify:CR=1 FL=1
MEDKAVDGELNNLFREFKKEGRKMKVYLLGFALYTSATFCVSGMVLHDANLINKVFNLKKERSQLEEKMKYTSDDPAKLIFETEISSIDSLITKYDNSIFF